MDAFNRKEYRNLNTVFIRVNEKNNNTFSE
jgi:hypothetical protein